LPTARAYLFDVTPRQLLSIAGDRFSGSYRKKLEQFRYGPGTFKIDYALSGPIPWQSPECASAATVHLGGTWEEIATSESEVARGAHPEKPFVILVQQSLFDPTRAPEGKHTAWAYCHVPNGSTVDMTAAIESQIERFAPDFRDVVLHRTVRYPADFERENANLVGGDIGGGATDPRQLLTRPFAKFDPYATSDRQIFICSSSTPPAGGVHGMCGYWAAHSALRKVFGIRQHALPR
jgi:phytoene dehydrogenase-like protein